MNNKGIIKFFFVFLVLLPHFNPTAYAKDNLPDSHEMSLGVFMNAKYGYLNYAINYSSPRFIWENQLGLNADLDAFYISEYVVGNFTRLNISADYKFPLGNSDQKSGQYLLPKAGMSVFFDVWDMFDPNKGFGCAPLLGLNYEYYAEKYKFYCSNDLTFFLDGVWHELAIGGIYKIWKWFGIDLKVNMISAFTYNGKSDTGFYPRISLYFDF
jgi:hypothetical protein